MSYRENYMQIASLATQKSLFTVANVLFYFLRDILCHVPDRQIPLKTIIEIVDFAIVAKDGRFWFSIVRSLQLICDVTWMRVTGIVTWYSSIVLARTAYWRKNDLQ